MNLCDLLLTGQPAGPVLVDTRERDWTYEHLISAVEHLCGFLDETSQPGDRCLIFAETGMLALSAYLAAIRSGRIAVPVAADCSEGQLRTIIANCTPHVAFVDAPRVEQISRLRQSDVTIVADSPDDTSGVVESDQATAFLPSEHPANVSQDETAAIFYGKDGVGTVYSHGNLAAGMEAIRSVVKITPGDHVMSTLPLSDPAGAAVFHAHLAAGACITIADPRQQSIPDRLSAAKSTGFVGREDFALTRRSFPQLRYILQFTTVPEKHSVPSTGKETYRFYGRPEAPFLAYLSADLVSKAPACVGKPAPGVRLVVMDEFGTPAGIDESGEIVASGASVARAYWHNPMLTQKRFRTGVLSTGHEGTRDAGGMFYVTGEMPAELGRAVASDYRSMERIVAKFPGVRDVAAVVKQDDLLGESIVLFVVHPGGEAARHDLTDFCAQHLPFKQRPRSIQFRGKLPRIASGAVDVAALVDELPTLGAGQAYVDGLQAQDGLAAQ